MPTRPKTIFLTLKRLVRSISVKQTEAGASAFSLAMVVFLVQKVQAAELENTTLGASQTEEFGLQQFRELFGNAKQDSIAGIDYSAILKALAQIKQLDDNLAAAEEQANQVGHIAAGLGGDAQAVTTDFELVGSDAQDAVQYAQASLAEATVEGAEAGGTLAITGITADVGAMSPLAASGLAGLPSTIPLLLGGVTLAAAGGGGGGSSGGGTSGAVVVVPGTVETTAVSSTAANGYTAGAKVFQDLNGNNKWDDGEPNTTTASDGRFILKGQPESNASIVITGGTDLSTGLAYGNILKGPPSATVITPLTTLVTGMMANGKSQAEALSTVLKAFGLPEGTNLLNFDPVTKVKDASAADLAVKVQAAGVLVAILMDAGGSALAGSSGGSANSLSYNIAKSIAGMMAGLPPGQTLNLADAQTLKSILSDSAISANLTTTQVAKLNAVSDSASKAVAAVNGAVRAAEVDPNKSAVEKFKDFAKAQAVVQGALSDDIKKAADSGDTSNIPDEPAIKQAVDEGKYPNHAPKVAGPLSVNATEGGTSTSVDLLKEAKDLDVGDIAGLRVKPEDITYKVGTGGASSAIPAGLSIKDGTLTVDPKNAAFNHLATGETQTITASYKISDAHGGTVEQAVTVTVTGKSQIVDITYSEALRLITERTYYSADDVVTVKIGSSEIPPNRLGTIANLETLGVDFVDIGDDGTFHITPSEASALYDAKILFATSDVISLDLTTDQLRATGSHLSGSLSDAIVGATHGLSLSGLHDLGVDLIDIGGAVNQTLHISTNDAKDVQVANLVFASNDAISIDVNILASDQQQGHGSYLSGSLNDAISSATGGLGLSGLHALGVDLIDIGGDGVNATLHISVKDAAALANAGLRFAAADHIVVDEDHSYTSTSRSSSTSTIANKLDSIVGDSLGSHATGIDQVGGEKDLAVTLQQHSDFVLGADQSLEYLLIALSDSGVTAPEIDQPKGAMRAVSLDANVDIVVNDTMVKALMDAGILLADVHSAIKLDTQYEHMSTSLLQLIDIGVDKVVTNQDKVYIDLGDVKDADTLTQLLSGFFEGKADASSSPMFVLKADGESVKEAGLLLTVHQVALATAIEANDSLLAQLTHAGITELLIATDEGVEGDVHILGHAHHKQPLV